MIRILFEEIHNEELALNQGRMESLMSIDCLPKRWTAS